VITIFLWGNPLDDPTKCNGGVVTIIVKMVYGWLHYNGNFTDM